MHVMEFMRVARNALLGKVRDNQDPLGLGRVQVALTGFDGAIELPWIRVVCPSASEGAGHVFLPEKGDEVVVLVGGELSDTGAMFVLGAVYHRKHRPSYANEDGDNAVKRIRTRSGNELVFCDREGEEYIALRSPRPGADVEVTLRGADGRLTIESSSEVLLRGARIELQAANVEIKASLTTVLGEFKHS